MSSIIQILTQLITGIIMMPIMLMIFGYEFGAGIMVGCVSTSFGYAARDLYERFKGIQ